MRILQIINSLETGGAERLALSLHGKYLLRGHDSRILALAGEVPEAAVDGVYGLGSVTPYDPLMPSRLLDLSGDEDPAGFDVVHAHLFPCQLWTALMEEMAGLEGVLVTTEHSTSNRRRGRHIWKPLEAWFYRCYDAVVCVSGAASQQLREWLPELAGSIEVIHNGIELEEFAISQRRRKRSGTTVLSVGRLTEAKNYIVALEAFALVKKSLGPGLSYLIAGGGPLEGSLREHACRLGIGESVEFLGDVRDVASLMEESDLFFMPSSREGFGIAALEAMAAGLPVVASDLQGISEVVGSDGECGLLADPTSPEDLAAAMERLLCDTALVMEMRSAARKRAELFSLDRTADGYLDLFGRTLAREAG